MILTILTIYAIIGTLYTMYSFYVDGDELAKAMQDNPSINLMMAGHLGKWRPILAVAVIILMTIVLWPFFLVMDDILGM